MTDPSKGILVRGVDNISADEYADITSMDDAIALLQSKGIIVVEAADEIGDGFLLIDDKSKLIDIPLLIISWNVNAGDFSQTFVSVRAIARFGQKEDTKIVFNDGGTGIKEQLEAYAAKYKDRPMGGIFVHHGLRASVYGLDKDDQPVKLGSPEAVGKAVTYYLNTSK